MTVVVNLFAGPGAGKSTAAAGIFAELKKLHLNVELVTEFAKDLTWDERHFALEQQPYILGEQFYRQIRLAKKVDAIITDSPLLLGIYYNNLGAGRVLEHLGPFSLELHNLFDNLCYFLERRPEYSMVGRRGTLEEAKKIDSELKAILVENEILFSDVSENVIEIITNEVYAYLKSCR